MNLDDLLIEEAQTKAREEMIYQLRMEQNKARLNAFKLKADPLFDQLIPENIDQILEVWKSRNHDCSRKQLLRKISWGNDLRHLSFTLSFEGRNFQFDVVENKLICTIDIFATISMVGDAFHASPDIKFVSYKPEEIKSKTISEYCYSIIKTNTLIKTNPLLTSIYTY